MTEKKKNKKFLLFVVLIILVAISGAIIGTFAKYITSEKVSDDAVVAKFGLDIPDTINLFSDSYTNVEADAEGKKIIAPGTSGQYKFVVTGTSEVAYKVESNIGITYSEEWDGYTPLEFSVDGNTWTNFTVFKTNLSNALESQVMAPNTEYASTQTIYWRWPFYTSAENDIKDTKAGIASAEGTAPEVTIDIEMTAKQVD